MKRNKNKLPFILAGIGFILALLVLIYFINKPFSEKTQSTPKPTTQEKIVIQNQDNSQIDKNTNQSDIFKKTYPVSEIAENTPIENVINEKDVYETKELTADQDSRLDIAIRNLDIFFIYLDEQNYYQNLNLPMNSRDTFSSLVQKLIDNPPVTSGEADDLFTLLKNTAHFFRVLGESNIVLLKHIFTHEADKIESLSEDLFIVLNYPDMLFKHYNIKITDTALYEYSSFLMNTMGGRLYMFRRDMEIRMVVSYYSILFVEKAEEKGLNNHGLDVIPFVTSLIKEVENHGQKLLMRDTYLERLYEIDQRTNR